MAPMYCRKITLAVQGCAQTVANVAKMESRNSIAVWSGYVGADISGRSNGLPCLFPQQADSQAPATYVYYVFVPG